MRRLRVAAIAATLVAGAIVTVIAGAAPAQAAPVICDKFGATRILNGQFIVMNNVWGADTAQCIDVNQSGGFTVTQAAHNKPTNGAPAAYPAIYAGCHYAATPADCTSGSGLPMQANSSTFPNVRTSVNYTYPAGGTWNAAYDIWFDPTPRIDGQNTGAEIMIWLNFQGGINPAGSRVVQSVNLAGGTWEVWFASVGWNVVTYRRTSATTSLNFAVNTFYADAVSRGFAQSNWYMTSVQAGSEPWVGGAGMTVNSFTYTTQGQVDNIPPSQPQNLTASGTTATSTNLSWSPSTDNVGVTGYTIFRRQGTSGTFTNVGTSTGTTFTAGQLTANTQYQFNVVARDAAGNNSTASANVTVTTGQGGDTIPPSIPQNLTASGTTSSSTNLSWSPSTDNIGVAGYTVFRRQGTSGTFTQVGTPTGTTFTAGQLSANTTYQFNVVARDAAGNASGASNTVTVTTTGGGGPGTCSVTTSIPNPWDNGYVVYVRITNTGTTTITGWSTTFTLPAGHAMVGGGWNAVFTPNGQNFTARNMGHNGTLAPAAFTEWGFQASRPSGNTQLPTFGSCAVG